MHIKAVAQAEVFQSSFVLYLYICFLIGQRFRADGILIPNLHKALPLVVIVKQHQNDIQTRHHREN